MQQSRREYIKTDGKYVWGDIAPATVFADGSAPRKGWSENNVVGYHFRGEYVYSSWFDWKFTPLATANDLWLWQKFRGTGNFREDLTSFTVGTIATPVIAAGIVMGGFESAPVWPWIGAKLSAGAIATYNAAYSVYTYLGATGLTLAQRSHALSISYLTHVSYRTGQALLSFSQQVNSAISSSSRAWADTFTKLGNTVATRANYIYKSGQLQYLNNSYYYNDTIYGFGGGYGIIDYYPTSLPGQAAFIGGQLFPK